MPKRKKKKDDVVYTPPVEPCSNCDRGVHHACTVKYCYCWCGSIKRA